MGICSFNTQALVTFTIMMVWTMATAPDSCKGKLAAPAPRMGLQALLEAGPDL